MKQHFQQIDILKGLAIIAVLLLHSLSREQLQQSYAVFHIWQAVPIFLVLMGLNLGFSSSGRSLYMGQLYTAHYFSKKATRILFPLLIMYVVALVAGYVWEQVYGRDVYTLGWENFIGVLPVSGKGNYFITLLLQSLLLLPLIGYTFHRWPLYTTLVLVAVEVAFQLLANHVTLFDEDRYLYDAAFFRYLSAIVLGLWLAQVLLSASRWVHLIFIGMGLMSGVYLYLLQYHNVRLLPFRPEWQSQVFLTFPYGALIIYIVFKVFPPQSRQYLLRAFAVLGQASYHIFLVQVLYFGLVLKDSNVWLNLGVSLAGGIMFYRVETAFSKKVASPRRTD